jgi:hypothetical protein
MPCISKVVQFCHSVRGLVMKKKGKWWQYTAFDHLFIGIIFVAAIIANTYINRNFDRFWFVLVLPFGRWLLLLLFVAPFMFLYWLLGSIFQRGDDDDTEDV